MSAGAPAGAGTGATSLRLFLSADLAGSTAFKQTKPAVEWQRFFSGFYRQLPPYVERQFTVPVRDRLALWKTVGDEIVFSARLLSSADVPLMVGAFRRGVAEYRRQVLAAQGDLDIKAAGWTAGFPVGNLEVELPGGAPQVDYIGPGMDTGFRLVKEASPRRMLIAVELAYLLTLPGLPDPHLHKGPGLPLKGVARGRPYPRLWLDCFDPGCSTEWDLLELEEERLSGATREPCPQGPLHDYCRRWLREMGDPFVIPFIAGDPLIGQPPEGYQRRLAEVTTQTQGAEAMRDQFQSQPAAPAGETEGPREFEVFIPAGAE